MKVLVIAAHPDDEVLGCGATIAKHANKGDVVDILILGDGVTARYSEKDLKKPEVIKLVKKMNKDAINASKILGVNNLKIIGKKCCRFDKIPIIELVKIIERKIFGFKPDRIYTHCNSDVNIDHGIVFKAVQIATRPLPDYQIKDIFLMEILSSTEWNFSDYFKPNFYIEVTETIDKKVEALIQYSGEIRKFPHPRSKEAVLLLAKKRGCEVGIKNAEAFELVRSIQK